MQIAPRDLVGGQQYQMFFTVAGQVYRRRIEVCKDYAGCKRVRFCDDRGNLCQKMNQHDIGMLINPLEMSFKAIEEVDDAACNCDVGEMCVESAGATTCRCALAAGKTTRDEINYAFDRAAIDPGYSYEPPIGQL